MYTKHFGIKHLLTDDLAVVTLFSSKINELTYPITNSEVFKGINKLIFADNTVLSNYYTYSYDVTKFPAYVKNFTNKNGLHALVDESFKQFQFSYNQTLGNSTLQNFDDTTKLLYLLKSNFSAHYVEFGYNDSYLCSSSGILTRPVSQLFLHTFNKNSHINLDLRINNQFNTVYSNEEVVKEYRNFLSNPTPNTNTD